MCTLCQMTQTFDPTRHETGAPIFADTYEIADAASHVFTTYSMSAGDAFFGSLDAGFIPDEDWVEIDLQAGQRYEFELEGLSTSQGTLSDPILTLNNFFGQLVAQDDDGGTDLNSSLSFTAVSTGTYYLEVAGYVNIFGTASTGTYRLTASEVAPLSIATLDELAYQLTDGFWGDQQFTFDISTSNEITVNLTGLTADGQQLARWAMEAWEMVANLTFTEVTSGEMITMDDENGGAYAYTPDSVTPDGVELNISQPWLLYEGTTIDSYSFQTYVHEIGHTLGLGHMGDYDGGANYGANNLFLNDSWQTSVMSYFDQNDNTDVNASYGYAAGLMMADVLAIQNLYGTPTSSVTVGDTTYGDNSNLTNYLDEVFDWLATGATTANVTGETMVFNLYDVDGFDRLDLNFSTTADLIDLREETFSNVLGGTGNLSISRNTTIEAVIAGSGDDTITGNTADNILEGRDGNDSIEAGVGNDTVYGGNNFDTITAGDGDDRVWGGNGQDLIFLNQGDDMYFDNGQGGVLGRDTVFTGIGNDTVEGGNGDDIFYGEDGNDVINARLGNDTVYGGNQFDTISAGEGNDEVHGGNGQDLIFLNQGDDIFYDNNQGGVLGRDTVFTGFGNDTVEGGNGAGDNVYFGEFGDDVINAGIGNDSIFGGDNFDTIDAGAGDDLVWGGNGRDQIMLGDGDDTYRDTAQLGVLGHDVITGGQGADTFVFMTGSGEDVITDFNAEDRLELASTLVDGRNVTDTIAELATVLQNYTDAGGNMFGLGTQLEFALGQTLYLEGVTDLSALSSEIFIF